MSIALSRTSPTRGPPARVLLEVPREHSPDAVVVREVAGKQPATLRAVRAMPHAHRLASDRRRVEPRATRCQPPTDPRRTVVRFGIGKAVVQRDARLGIAVAATFVDNERRTPGG